jgi:hypothetical protein
MTDRDIWSWLETNCNVQRRSPSALPADAASVREPDGSRLSLGEGGDLWLRWQEQQAGDRTTQSGRVSAASIPTEERAPTIPVATTEAASEATAPPPPPGPQPMPEWNPVQDAARYPEILMAAQWRRSRGLIAKAAGRTGMGAALSQLEREFHAVDWTRLKPVRPVPFNVPSWEKMFEDARSERAKVAAVHRRLQQLGELAARTAAQFRANRAIPRSAREACEQIARASAGMQQSCDDRFLRTQLDVAYDAGIGRSQQTLDILHTQIPGKVKDCLQALDKVHAEDDWHKQGIMTLTRNITQFTGNAEKLARMGFAVRVDVQLCKDLTRQLAPYAQNERPGMVSAAPWPEHHARLRNILLGMRDFPVVG